MAVKARKLRNLGEAIKANELYRRGDQAWSKGDLRPAFRLFWGPQERVWKQPSVQLAILPQRNRRKSRSGCCPDWYRLAYRRGDLSVANNIGCILRDRKKLGQAIGLVPASCPAERWRRKFEYSQIYLHKGDLVRTRSYLDKARRYRGYRAVKGGGRDFAEEDAV